MFAASSLFSIRNSLLIIVASLFMTIGSFSLVSAQNKGDICRGAEFTFNEKVGCGTDGQGVKYDAAAGNPSPQSSLNTLLDNIINIFSIVVGIVAVVMIIVGGFKFITSGGDSAKVTSSRNTIIYAIIGLIIVALAQTIAKFVLEKVT